jgi:hypothetical protein
MTVNLELTTCLCPSVLRVTEDWSCLAERLITAARSARLHPADVSSAIVTEAVIKLRPATLADLELLQHWDEQAHVIASDPNSDWGWEVELGRNPDWRDS